MRSRISIVCTLLLLATTAFGKEVFLSIGGSVGAFRTDARVFNPSADKEITIQAYYLPVGNANNAGEQPITFTVGKRQMKSYDDVVASLLNRGNLGAIRLVSADDFIATQRIYAVSTTCAGAINPCTLGQYVAGQEMSSAKKKGVLIQLKSNANYRTNIGAVNPNNTAASVTWRLYDKDNNLVATGTPVVMPPFAVIGPTNMAGTFFFNPGTADISDAWVSYTSDQPIFAYASAVDNGSTDGTYIPMAEDTGTTPAPAPTGTVVTLKSGSITVAPALNNLKAGDNITITIVNSTTDGVSHGFQLNGPTGSILVPSLILAPGDSAVRTFTVRDKGTYAYFCTVVNCTIPGHDSMIGSFSVESDDPYDPGRGY